MIQAPLPYPDLSGHIACVSGASSGLGRRAALVLARAGARVVALARRKEALQTLCAEADGEIHALPWDLADRAALKDLSHAAALPFGSPDILIHAAGINTRESADDLTPQGWDTTLNLNLAVPFFLSQHMIPAMQARGWGRIVNFASLQSYRAFPGGVSYGASKGGITQLTRAMAEAWSRHGICVNALGPGFFKTELTQAVFADPARAARNAAQTCIGRNGTVEDIDGPLLFFCSDACAFVTGQVLMVDGGFTAK